MRPFLVLLLLACSGGPTAPPADAKSLDYVLEPFGGHSGYTGRVWQDSSVWVVLVDPKHTAVRGAIVHYHATSGSVLPAVDTTSDKGVTLYVWRVPTDVASSGELFACVEASDGCADQRLVGFNFTPGS